MKRLNTFLFTALAGLLLVFIGWVMVRDTINRHQYERAEQATLEKIERQDQLIASLTSHQRQIQHTLDSIKRLYRHDSTLWQRRQRQLLINHRQTLQQLSQTRSQLNESVRRQRVVVPVAPHRRQFERITADDSTAVPTPGQP